MCRRASILRVGGTVAFRLVVGAVLTVCTTWIGIATTFGWGWLPDPLFPDGGKQFDWPHPVDASWAPFASARWHIESLWSDHATFIAPRRDPQETHEFMHNHSAGLPWRCLECWSSEEVSKVARTPCERRGEISAPRLPRNHFLPAIPVWPGFALNTIFYAGIAWGLWQVPLAIRRRRRRGTGVCVNCGYDRAGIAVDSPCPECGHAK